jgi:acetyltransferase-like isoleucine patch superfamily enzyme
LSFDRLIVPFLGTNDDSAVVLSISTSRDRVFLRDVELITVETTKSVIAITAPYQGFFYPFVSIGDRVFVNQVIGLISKNPLDSVELDNLLLEARTGSRHIEPKITAKAEKLADFLRIRNELNESLAISELIDSDIIEEYVENKYRLLPKESRDLIDKANNSTDLFIFGNGHGNHAISRQVNQFHKIRRIVLFDYSNKIIPNDGRFGIELPIWTAYKLVEGGNSCLVHLPYDILSTTRDYLEAIGPRFISFIHPAAIVCDTAKIGKSSVVMAGAVIEPEASIGDFCFIGANAVIGSEATIGDGAMILNSSSVAHNSLVGAGSVVADGSRVAGRVQLGSKVRLGLNSSVNAGIYVKESYRLKSNGAITESL